MRALVGDAERDRWRTRSYRASWRVVVGVLGAVNAPSPRCRTGVEGLELSKLDAEDDGVCGVKGVLAALFRDGV